MNVDVSDTLKNWMEFWIQPSSSGEGGITSSFQIISCPSSPPLAISPGLLAGLHLATLTLYAKSKFWSWRNRLIFWRKLFWKNGWNRFDFDGFDQKTMKYHRKCFFLNARSSVMPVFLFRLSHLGYKLKCRFDLINKKKSKIKIFTQIWTKITFWGCFSSYFRENFNALMKILFVNFCTYLCVLAYT